MAIIRAMRRLALLLPLLPIGSPANATDSQTPPYWASLRVDQVNMRVGPGEDYRINWVFHRAHLPVKVLRDMEGWRLVQDPGGARGWVSERFVSHQRSAIITGRGPVDMRGGAGPASPLKWRLLPGLAGALGTCSGGWCQFDVDGRSGYVPQARLWGAGNP